VQVIAAGLLPQVRREPAIEQRPPRRIPRELERDLLAAPIALGHQ